MRSGRLDGRVRVEAQALLREARAALALKRSLRGKAGDLESAATAVDEALTAKDYQRVRRGLPVLDALVDELVKRPARSTTRDYVESIGTAVLIALALRAVVLEAFKIPSSSMYPTLEVNDHIFVNKFVYGIRIPLTTTWIAQWGKPQRGEVIVFMWPCDLDRDYIKRVVATEGQSVEVRCNVVYVDGVPVENHLAEADTCSYDDYVESIGTWKPTRCSRYAEHVAGHDYFTFHDEDRPQRDQVRSEGAQQTGDGRDFPPLERSHAPPSCVGQTEASLGAPDQKLGKIIETRQRAGACDLQLNYVVPPGHVFVMGDNRANSNDSRYWGSVPIENLKGRALFIWLSYRDFDPRWKAWDSKFTFRWDRIGNFVDR